MAREFPRSVFKSPGKYSAGSGATFEYVLVEDEDEMKGALGAGYFESVPEAIENKGSVEAYLTKNPDVVESVPGDAPKRRGRPPKE